MSLGEDLDRIRATYWQATGLLRVKTSFNLFRRYAEVTSPSKGMRHGANRMMYDMGRYGTPALLGYLAGSKYGLWGEEDQSLPAAQSRAARSVAFNGPPSPQR